MTRTSDKPDHRFQSQAIEVIYDELVCPECIIKHLKTLNAGLYKCFIKWHKYGPEGEHTHVGLILGKKPKYEYHLLKDVFTVPKHAPPRLVEKLGKISNLNGPPSNKLSNLNKLKVYANYLTDGHDNGRYEDTWNYKYDHELIGCKPKARVLCLLDRGLHFDQIIVDGDWNFRAYCCDNEEKIVKMIDRWNFAKARVSREKRGEEDPPSRH